MRAPNRNRVRPRRAFACRAPLAVPPLCLALACLALACRARPRAPEETARPTLAPQPLAAAPAPLDSQSSAVESAPRATDPPPAATPDPHVTEAVAEARARMEAIREARAQRELPTARLEADLAVRALIAARAPPEDLEVGELLALLGEVAYELGALEIATTARRETYARLEARFGRDADQVWRARQKLAQCLYELGETHAALELARETLSTLERTSAPDRYELAIARLNVAAGIKAAGDLHGARALEEQVVSVWERTRAADDHDLQVARMNLAATLHELGELAGARALDERVLAVWKRTLPEDHPDLQFLRLNLSDLERSLGDAENAAALAGQVLAIWERTLPDDHPHVQAARLMLASALLDLGDLARARALAERALDIRERTLPGDHPDLQAARSTCSRILRQCGDAPAARVLDERVLAARERTLPPAHPELLGARLSLASTLRDLSELDSARAIVEATVEEAERTLPDGHPDLDRARNSLAATMIAMGDVDSALAITRRVLESRERKLPEDHFDVVSARVNVAAATYYAGDLAGAQVLLEDALARWERLLPPDSRYLATARDDLAWVAAGASDARALDRALAGLADGIRAGTRALASASPREARERTHSMSRRLWTILSLESSSSGLESTARAFELVENLRIQSVSRPRIDARASDEAARALRARVLDVRRELHDLVSGGSLRAGEGDALHALVRERDAIEAELARRLNEIGAALPELTVESLAAALPPDACAIAYRRYTRARVDDEVRHRVHASDRLLAHYVSPAGRVVRVDLGPIEPLEEAVKTWRAAIGRPLAARGRAVAGEEPAAGDEQQAGERLRELVLDPLMSAIGDARVVHVCADDALHLVPLDALPMGSRVVGDRMRLVNEVDFARLIVPPASRAEARDCFAVGGVEYDAGPPQAGEVVASLAPTPRSAGALADLDRWPYLAGSLAEVQRVGALYREVFGREPTLLTGTSASKSACFERLRGARFVHFATHGYFAPESLRAADVADDGGGWTPMRREDVVIGFAPMTLCGLVLAGANRGSGTVGRADGVLTAEELASADLASCELAVLSACDTSVGVARAGQGVRSLQAALHAAGASTAITSVWKVDDERARELFEDFYARIWSRGEGKADALWNAKLALRAKHYPTRDWGGWVLTGDAE